MCAQALSGAERGKRKTDFLSIRLEPDLREQLERRARENERTLAGEVRVAVRRYLESAAEAA
jgi:predicted DNA-binding protein